MSPTHRLVLKVARTIHVYLTLFGLVLILFFAVTGFMLNHESWFALDAPHTRTVNGKLSTPILDSVDRLTVVEELRRDFGAVGAMDSFDEEEESLRIVFKRPGTRIETTIQRADGKTELTFEVSGVVGIMTDLHRGKATGRAWSLVIDGVCVIMLIISFTGLILWSSLRSRGKLGVFAMSMGLLVGVGVYWRFVP